MYKTFTSLWYNLLAWLNETEIPVEPAPALIPWSDLPPYHPCDD